jgi:anti-sigma factor ChrR (cupin superfamily)
MTLSCYEATHALGAYLVGALDPRERADVEAHLAHCPACRDELAGLAALPGLMSRLTAEEVLAGPPRVDDEGPDGALLERLLTAADRDRKVAGRRRWLAAAAAVVALAGGGVGTAAVYNAATSPEWHSVAAAKGPVHMTVKMAQISTGTSLTLSLSGVPSDEHCRLIAISDNGAREVAGSWEATYSGTAVIKGTTSFGYKHLSRLVIETYAGQELVSSSV